MNEYLLAFTLGLLSTPHCVAMCGSLVGAMLMGSRSSGHVVLQPTGSTAAQLRLCLDGCISQASCLQTH